jgi:hypothetical protein
VDIQTARRVGLIGAILLVAGTSRAEFNKGPALQNVTTSSAVLLVHSDHREITVEWGLSAAYGEAVTLNDASASIGGHRVLFKKIDVLAGIWIIAQKDGWLFEVSLTDLEPDETYHYRVTNEQQGILGEEVTRDLTFTTGPLPGSPFVFVASGDNKAEPDLQTNLANLENAALTALMEADPEIRIFLDTGDIVPDSNPDANWAALYSIRRELFHSVAWYPAIGNHDFDQPDNGLNFQSYISVPRTPLPAGHGIPPNDEGALDDTELFYGFDYSNVHFVAFDGNGDMSEGSVQHQFIVDQLMSYRCKGPIVVYGHHPWFSSGLGGGGNPAMAAIYHALFVEHGVDLVLFGHQHFYERMDRVGMEGVQYIIAGGSGAALNDIAPPSERQHSVVAVQNYHYVRFLVDGWLGSGYAIDRDGNVFDSFALGDMSVNDPADCWVPGDDDAPQDDGAPRDGGEPGDENAPAGAAASAGDADVSDPERHRGCDGAGASQVRLSLLAALCLLLRRRYRCMTGGGAC